MRVLVYGPILQVGASSIRQELAAVIPERQMDVCSELGTLCSYLRKADNHYTIALIVCGTRDDLLRISSIAHLLQDLRIVLLIPDLDEASLSMGHRLFPRYLTSLDAGLEEVTKVVKNLLNGHMAEWARASRSP